MLGETIFVTLAALPGAYALVCLFRRAANARRALRRARKAHEREFKDLHWLARRNAWAAVEALISRGVIGGAEAHEFRRRDEQLERASWVGLAVSAALLLAYTLIVSVVELVA